MGRPAATTASREYLPDWLPSAPKQPACWLAIKLTSAGPDRDDSAFRRRDGNHHDQLSRAAWPAVSCLSVSSMQVKAIMWPSPRSMVRWL
jgi:hypothetical protein